MMKNTKRNWSIVALMTALVTGGNVATNICILKKNGYIFNRETMRYEKMCPFGIDLSTQEKVDRSNLIWGIAGAIVGVVVNRFFIEKR